MKMVETLGWVLVHFAWQGIVAAAVLWIVLRLMPSGRASVRYVFGCAVLALMAVAPVATAIRLMAPHPELLPAPPPEARVPATFGADTPLEARRRAASTFVPGVGAGNVRPATARSLVSDVNAALPWVVAGWALGVLLLSVRLLGGWRRTYSLRTQGLSSVPAPCVDTIARLIASLHISRPVTFAVSLSVPVPMILGHLKPVVLLPVAALSSLS